MASGHAVLLITHDLAAAARAADRVAVMYAGRIVELGPAADVLDHGRHPYTRGLVDALPDRAFTPVPGHPPLLTDLPTGCAFRPRCPRADQACHTLPPLDGNESDGDGDHFGACHHPAGKA